MRVSEVGSNSTLETTIKQYASYVITDFSNEKMVVSTLVLHVNGKYHKSIVKDTNPLSSLYFNVKMNLNRLLSL